MSISINDKVKIKFGIHVNKKGYTGKTDFAIGTVVNKAFTIHNDYNRPEVSSTSYLIKFDEEYVLERSDDYKKRFIFNYESDKFITELVFCDLPNSHGCLYLKPMSMELVK